MSWYDPDAVLTYPSDLTWEKAMVLLHHYEVGRKTNDRMVRWREMIDAIYTQHGFQAFDAATELRENDSPTLLLFEPGKPHSERHRLPETCFRDPVPLFAAINDAERRHNERYEALHEKYRNDKAAGKKVSEPAIKKVLLTQMPSQEDTAGLGLTQAQPATAAMREGDVVMNGSTPCELVRENGRMVLRPLAVMQPPEVAAPVGNDRAQRPARRKEPKRKAEPPPPPAKARKKGHRVA